MGDDIANVSDDSILANLGGTTSVYASLRQPS